MEYSEPKIVSQDTLKKRSYVTFYYKGKRVREFNGNNLGLKIQPNYAKSLEERNKLLKKLEYELLKALENNCYPNQPIVEVIVSEKKTTLELLNNALIRKLSSNLNKYYKKNLESIQKQFVSFLTKAELDGDIKSLKKQRIDQFLSTFNSSGTYYMNKRRDLGVLFSSISKEIEYKLNVVKDSETRKAKATLHKIYSDEQIKFILPYLKKHHPKVYICCLLSYGCFLRPHREVRELSVHHFKNDLTEIQLAGHENKGGRVRVVYIPDYVRKELVFINELSDQDCNIFTGIKEPHNDCYFNKAWKNAWKKMFALNMIEKDQTLYSFRHTAAVKVYRKTKDLNIIQQLLGHSDMIVTLKYLRGLGEATNSELRDHMPELDLD
ncbi:tyrosine-type recombinase/integrase [Pedobacter sp. WC2501]|uniref:tyrosine-type recombinase/integrase n=1 Tax=Pedobacter sp. WC2501 TaxID=3461400 RepID=UPI0040463A8E